MNIILTFSVSNAMLLLYETYKYRLPKSTKIPQTRISEILKGNRRVTADTALRLSIFFGTTAKFWFGLQDDFDIEEERAKAADALATIKRYYASAAKILV